jgi:Ca2+-binding EF-hand superfamily protein
MKLKYLAVPALVAFALPALAQQPALNESHLKALDSNGNGAISKSEFDAFSDFAFEKMDKDGNNMLSPDEVDDYVIGDAFDMLDDDGDGAVSAGEFASQMEEDFNTADKDGDGILN